MSKYKTGDRFEIVLGEETSPGTFEVVGLSKRLNNYHLDKLKKIKEERIPKGYKDGIMKKFIEVN